MVGREAIDAGGLMILPWLDLEAVVKVDPHMEGYIINEDIDNILGYFTTRCCLQTSILQTIHCVSQLILKSRLIHRLT